MTENKVAQGNLGLYTHTLPGAIEDSLKDSLILCKGITDNYGEDLLKSPFEIDLLYDALRSENLKETAHSRILYRILQDEAMQKAFLKKFLPGADSNNIDIPYPDRDRIDLTIKGDNFFLIIENKVNYAGEQEAQIDRYVCDVAHGKYRYPYEQIYVLYLNRDGNEPPSSYSLSDETKRLLGDKLMVKNYREDIYSWIKSVYDQVSFDKKPYLKSTLLCYMTYLETIFNLNEMNNMLDEELSKSLELDKKTMVEKIKVLEDQLTCMDKIRERLEAMLTNCREQRFEEWYKQCVGVLSGKGIELTKEGKKEFGFYFKYEGKKFRCQVDNDGKWFWGICGRGETTKTCPEIFESLKNIVLQSNKGFTNCATNSPEWVVSDYYKEGEDIAERFVDLANIICDNPDCTIIK